MEFPHPFRKYREHKTSRLADRESVKVIRAFNNSDGHSTLEVNVAPTPKRTDPRDYIQQIDKRADHNMQKYERQSFVGKLVLDMELTFEASTEIRDGGINGEDWLWAEAEAGPILVYTPLQRVPASEASVHSLAQ